MKLYQLHCWHDKRQCIMDNMHAHHNVMFTGKLYLILVFAFWFSFRGIEYKVFNTYNYRTQHIFSYKLKLHKSVKRIWYIYVDKQQCLHYSVQNVYYVYIQQTIKVTNTQLWTIFHFYIDVLFFQFINIKSISFARNEMTVHLQFP